MTSDLDSGGESPSERRRQRRFRVRVWLGAGCYLFASLALSLSSGPWRLVWAVLSLLLAALLVVLTVLRVRQMDEYQIKLFFPGLAVGFAAAMFAALTVGTLNATGLHVPNGGWPVCIIGMLAWQVTNLVVGAPQR
ncbi:hypothetical protein [Amycolatopsis pigmentata]|uniref:Transmembrane protein n=1 Tax=Amycolatopsis pigmentata TaxID=450801 RepID=A0ABW5FTT3_9PSEU